MYNGFEDGPEDEREGAMPFETDGDLDFLPDANEWVEPAEGEDPLYDLLKIERPEDEDGS